jgi:translation initiation factor eIF-2B subunit delta
MTDLTSILDEIRRDNRSGATALLHRAADAIRYIVNALPPDGPDWRPALTDAAQAVASVRPPFASFVRLASAVLDATDAATTAEDARQRVNKAIEAFLAAQEADVSRIVEHAIRLIATRWPRPQGDSRRYADPILMTISASSLVERVLLAATTTTPLSVVCLESRPANEGAALAERLTDAGLYVTYAVDAAGPMLVGIANVVLLGCDTLAPRYLLHKVGTFGLVLAAHRADVPIYALGGFEKLLPSLVHGAIADGGPPDEIFAAPPSRLHVINRYFDRTPLELLTGVILPDGLISPSEAAKRAAAVNVHHDLLDLLAL